MLIARNIKDVSLKCLTTLIILILLSSFSFCQETNLDQKVNVDYIDMPLEMVLDDLASQTGIKFSYSSRKIDINQKITLQSRDITLSDLLVALFEKSGIEYELVGGYMVLKKASKKNIETRIQEIKFVTISGYIIDAVNKETMIGATIYDPISKTGVMTNNYGFYSLSLPPGEILLEASFLGYTIARQQFKTENNITWNVSLDPTVSEVEEVVITSVNREQEIFTSLSGQTNIKPFEVKRQSAALGETDVLKTLNNLPGITFHNDGSSYFYVRGGQRDQNLIILDEATLYNPSHLFGLFTPVIPDAIKHTEIYKGDFPIQYGGRLSSVIDIRTKDGNMEKFSGSASVGLVTNRYNLEGPFKNKHSSYFISYRRSHFGFLFKKVLPSIRDFYFNDFTTKLNFKLSPNDRLFVTLYAGKDKFLVKTNNNTNGLEWGNASLTLRWNHIFGDRIFSNTTFYTSRFDYFLHTNYERNINWNSHISSANLKSEFTYFANSNNKIRFGFNMGGYFFNPGNYNAENFPIRYSVSTVNSGEFIVYAGNEQNITERIKLNYGIRLSSWSDYGESFIVKYNENFEATGIKKYEKGEQFYLKHFLEPRISLSLKTGMYSSVKFSYNRTIQNINLINNSISPFNTLEVWLPSGPNIKPQKANIYNFGFVKTWDKQKIDLNVDIFYKSLFNQVGYTYHADMLLNPLLDSQIRQGKGKAYGFEFFIRKTQGKFSGQAGYGYTRSFLRIEDLNNDLKYPSHQDRPVDLSFMLNYRIKPRTLINLNYIYTSGMRITTPTGFYEYRGTQVPFYSEQNNSRLPDYKRLDVAVTFDLNKYQKKYNHELNISVFNFFGYENPAFLNFNKVETNDGFLVPADKINTEDLKVTYRYIYSVIPSITYTINF